ncbi:hypothetical protein EJ05DRAFT_481786 [Pseudovirgaria hyperparasitica]|uniref:Secreted protein n=1 Tax=Pseudovirgaria hyperparasitica TaxID=470096 RepID=A0A6A6WL37_9PEZI|nr:uncharacterized protein EJ05DRAFT_481786 [Pseudovirgaria hyperparasitica]KAF2762915.1 hypothetical protein EJ05DRAFT_481786 [Pseudovirgaria hyperparasitica]
MPACLPVFLLARLLDALMPSCLGALLPCCLYALVTSNGPGSAQSAIWDASMHRTKKSSVASCYQRVEQARRLNYLEGTALCLAFWLSGSLAVWLSGSLALCVRCMCM